MRVTKGLLTGLLAMILISALYGQNHSETTGDIIWSLGPEDPRIDLRFGTKGLNIGGSEMAACIIKNNFQEELLLKLRFTITDFCGQRKVFTTPEVKLASHATYAPNPFFEGFTYDTGCKETAEYGRSKKSKTKIQRVDFETVFIRDLTAEKKKAEAERVRKEAEDMKRLEEAVKAREEAKAEKAKADAAERARKEREEKTQRVREARESQATQGAAYASGRSTATGSSSITKDNVADYLHAQEQAKQEAKLRAEEEEKARKQEHYEAQMAEFKRIEEAQVAEAQRIENLVERHIQHANDVDNFRDKAWQVEQAQRLENNHNDIARMEREYEQKLADLNVAMNELEAARRQEWSSRVQTGDWKDANGNANPALGELVETTGALVNMLGEASRKREAKEALERERRNFLARVEAEKAQMRFKLRHEMMRSKFPVFQLPKGEAPAPTSVYGFYILYRKQELGAPQSTAVVSNVIEIGTYDDGAWPSALYFSLAEKEKKSGYDGCYFHSQNYGSSEEANQMRRAFIDFFSREGRVTQIHFDTDINPARQRMDFWETKAGSLK